MKKIGIGDIESPIPIFFVFLVFSDIYSICRLYREEVKDMHEKKFPGDVRKYNRQECNLALESMYRERDRHVHGNDMWRMYNSAIDTVNARLHELNGGRVQWVVPHSLLA